MASFKLEHESITAFLIIFLISSKSESNDSDFDEMEVTGTNCTDIVILEAFRLILSLDATSHKTVIHALGEKHSLITALYG